jgi:hypothetical protein
MALLTWIGSCDPAMWPKKGFHSEKRRLARTESTVWHVVQSKGRCAHFMWTKLGHQWTLCYWNDWGLAKHEGVTTLTIGLMNRQFLCRERSSMQYWGPGLRRPWNLGVRKAFVYTSNSAVLKSAISTASKSTGFGLRNFSTHFLAAGRSRLSWILK